MKHGERKAYLLLEDGTAFEGKGFGAAAISVGEVVFTTGMTGYQETLTDPSYYRQIVTFTYPLIGNYGLAPGVEQSWQVRAFGVVVREAAPTPSHRRSVETLDEYLRRHGVPGIEGIDTRSLVRHIRREGTMKGALVSTGPGEGLPDKAALWAHLEQPIPRDHVAQVTARAPYRIPGQGKRVVLVDYGLKHGMLESLRYRNCDIYVVPAWTPASEILALRPQGVVLSNGPGDPQDIPEAAETVRELLGRVPLFGICLGHQVFALACGGRTEKMSFGHRGCNHPVKDLTTGRVMITSQNHGYVVSREGLPEDLEVTHVNQNDGTVEGLRHRHLPAFSVQFHPEARPGPDDAAELFDRFLEEIDNAEAGVEEGRVYA
ncbi:glutamine-hydrolyzing carbamoyl-phosphate synthase small subunit [Kyrpidia sp.]|uniref:glutamine-hydrolyzing carbamoyl-phosphate synthase small subunit n=1 Tax=Kyrpidia sp. TaxID=2073077 RepID=UPI002583EC49|nr:glutamine-hydrolyzing carbamoyl-phosphate synthase small subunit [Kyrpidia sp.]MCL6575756.1 glutamine-hydrolyzing carbamoyl-phosphate synthase small subunit [Kyrpidia sp.]